MFAVSTERLALTRSALRRARGLGGGAGGALPRFRRAVALRAVLGFLAAFLRAVAGSDLRGATNSVMPVEHLRCGRSRRPFTLLIANVCFTPTRGENVCFTAILPFLFFR